MYVLQRILKIAMDYKYVSCDLYLYMYICTHQPELIVFFAINFVIIQSFKKVSSHSFL